jgi:ADP-heptose:LPS heptosyltransferase
MEFLKPAELLLRRFLLRILRFVVKRGRPLSADLDFSTKKFLFVRQDRIGDVLVSTPLLHALKNRYPLATVDFLLSTNNHFVLLNEPLVRKRWVYEKAFISAARILRGLRREKYDFVVDLMDNPSATSTIFCALAGGRWNVGLSKDNAYSYDVVVPLLSRKETHIVDRLAMLLTVFGINPADANLRVRYNVQAESEAFASACFADRGLVDRKVIGINISPGEGTRFWGRDKYQALIKWLQLSFPDSPIVVLFQPSDKLVAEGIANPFPDVVLSPETRTFDQFAALVQRLWTLITPDTSAVHLAAAFFIPSVVLYVQSDKDLRVWEPYGSRSESVVTDVDDLRTISVDSVAQAFGRLVKGDEPNTFAGRRSAKPSTL